MIYLIHLNTPMAHAQHSLGFVAGDTADVQRRLSEHRNGVGARMLAAANRQGIGYEVVATFPGDRTRERQMKNWKKIRAKCPICAPSKSN